MSDKDFEKLFKQSEEITPRTDLKNEILAKATQEMTATAIKKEKKSPQTALLVKRIIPIAACFVFAFILIGGLLGLSNENYQTVYIDVNPSVALHINRFDYVSDVEYLNKDAKKTLNGIKLKGLSAEEALEKMIAAYDEAGYFDGDAEIYISAISDKSKNNDELLTKLSEHAEKIKGNRNYSVNTTKVTSEERAEADQYGVSPGKYRIISEIIGKHPKYTVEELKDKSMAELQELLDKNKGNDKSKEKNKEK